MYNKGYLSLGHKKLDSNLLSPNSFLFPHYIRVTPKDSGEKKGSHPTTNSRELYNSCLVTSKGIYYYIGH